MDCKHENFACNAGIHRIAKDEGGPISYFSAEINIHCRDCGQKFEFVGLPLGVSPYRPTVSIDALTLTAPIMPEGMKVPEGLPSLSVRPHGVEQ